MRDKHIYIKMFSNKNLVVKMCAHLCNEFENESIQIDVTVNEYH